MNENDFKYFLQDVSNLYIGAGYSYGELLELDEIPFKLKMLLSGYMLKEVAPETRIRDHIFFLKPDSMTYLMYSRMKARFHLRVWQEGQGSRGPGYEERICRIEEIAGSRELEEKKDEIIVYELHITKLGLMGVSV